MPDRPWVRTTCPYCGTGCGVRVKTDAQGAILALEGDPDHPANAGRLCGKGMALAETLPMDRRLTTPMLHGRPASWDEALTRVAHGLRDTIRTHGPDAVGFHLSGQLLTEDYYVANKLMKGFIGAANVDGNSRLCMASAVVGHKRAFGADLVPGCYEDLDLAELVIASGSNTAWCHPILHGRVITARERHPGRMLVVIDPRRTQTAMQADLHLPVRGGTDAWLWLGLLHHLHLRGMDPAFAPFVRMDAGVLELAAAYGQNTTAVAAATGLEREQVERFYHLFARTEKTVTLFSQGINQSENGSDTVSAILNCHLFTGRIGRPGMGPFSLTGQPNAMGGREVGALANQLAAHMSLDDPAHRKIVSRFWGSDRLATRPGLKAVEMFQAAEAGRIRALWIMGTNPMVSLPDGHRVRRALERCPLVIVSDAVADTDTARFAHILLPARPWGEKCGTVTNSERRISRQRAFLPPTGQAMPDWWMMARVGQLMGHGHAFDYPDAASVFAEHATLSGLGNDGQRAFDIAPLADAAYDALQPIQWPVRRDADGQVRGVARPGGAERFFTPDGKARLVEILPAAVPKRPDGLLRLNTGRIRDQWHTMTRTGVSPTLSRHEPEPTLDIHPDDARRLGLRQGELARIENGSGTVILKTRISAHQRPGELFAPMHWSRRFCPRGAVNELIPPRLDPESGQPASKGTEVSVVPLQSHWRGLLLTRLTPAAPSSAWWCRRPLPDGVWQYDLEGLSPLEQDWPGTSAAWLGAPDDAEWIEFTDAARGRFRRAWRQEGRLMGCLFIEHSAPLPNPERLAGCFSDQAWSATVLLSGAMAPAPPADRLVCACRGVGEQRLKAAIRAGERSLEGLIKRLAVGTGCGSCMPEVRGLLAAAG